MEISHEYDDIIHLPHHVSADRPHMPLIARGAQFAPFAALTGYEAAIEETARLTDQKLQLDEEQKQMISRCLADVSRRIREKPLVTLTYFVPDMRKSGGEYVSRSVGVKRVDALAESLFLLDGSVIPFNDIYAIEISDAEQGGNHASGMKSGS